MVKNLLLASTSKFSLIEDWGSLSVNSLCISVNASKPAEEQIRKKHSFNVRTNIYVRTKVKLDE